MPRTGPCSPWITGEDVAALPRVATRVSELQPGLSVVDPASICAEAAVAASEILFVRSGRVYTGSCGPVTIRPVARPTDMDERTWLGSGGAWGYSSSWGSCNYYGLGAGGVVSHFGCSNPPEIELGTYPVTSIIQVLIDGVLIPPDEYELRDYRTLVRMRPTPSYVPTERYGWPTCQIQDLPDSQQGTFSVTFDFGQDPGSGGRMAAKALAQAFALAHLGVSDAFPQRITKIERQGISAAVTDVIDILAKGALGIYEVDAWLASVNPQSQRTQSSVWSPDIGRPRRQQYPSVSG